MLGRPLELYVNEIFQFRAFNIPFLSFCYQLFPHSSCSSLILGISSLDSFQLFPINYHTLGIMATTQPNGLAVPDATIHPVETTSDVLELMKVGHLNRAVCSTALNERSSRSHRF